MTTMVADFAYSSRDYGFFLLNLGIIAGYCALVFTMLFSARIVPTLNYFLSRRSRIAAALFWGVAAITRAELAWNTVNDHAKCPTLPICAQSISNPSMLFHFLQFVFVWVMVVSVTYDLLHRFKLVSED